MNLSVFWTLVVLAAGVVAFAATVLAIVASTGALDF
jgi:hypothetical protein